MKSDHLSNGRATMNPLQRALIEKAGHDNGFEYVLPGDAQHVVLASSRHPAPSRFPILRPGRCRCPICLFCVKPRCARCRAGFSQ